MKREDIQEYLDCNGFEALTSSQGTRYYDEETVISIALEVVKNRSIPAVGHRRELLCAFFKYFRDNGEANIGMTIEEFVDGFLSTQYLS